MRTVNIALFACILFVLMQFLTPMVWPDLNPFVVGAVSALVVAGMVSMADNAIKKIIPTDY